MFVLKIFFSFESWLCCRSVCLEHLSDVSFFNILKFSCMFVLWSGVEGLT